MTNLMVLRGDFWKISPGFFERKGNEMKIYAKIAALYMMIMFFAACQIVKRDTGITPKDDNKRDSVITLKDDNSGNTVELYSAGDKEDDELLLYVNERFGYSVKVPYKVFTSVVVIPDNEDGIILSSADGQYRFRVSGGFVMFDDNLQTSLENAKKYVEENVDGAMVYEKSGDNWWTLSWWNGQDAGSRKFLTNGEVWCEIEITEPGQAQNAPGEYDELMERAQKSLTLRQ